MIVDTARDLFGYRGKVVHRPPKRADYLVDNPNRRCPVIDKASATSATIRKLPLDEGLAPVADLVSRQLNGGRRDAGLHHRSGLRRTGHRRMPG